VVPDPPKTLRAVNAWRLEKGREIHRIYSETFDANGFNPCRGNPTRFAPIHSAGKCVESLYGAETLECAAFETVFHDVPVKAKIKAIPLRDLDGRAHAVLEVKRDLHLAALFAPDLKNLGLKRSQLIDVTPKWYRATAAWAQAIHAQYRDIEGLVWTSRQCDPNLAFLFFGDRVGAADFEVRSATSIRSTAGMLRAMREFGSRAGIVLIS